MVTKLPARVLLNRKHPLSPLSDRVLFTLAIFISSIMVATLVIHFSENWTLINSFYFIAMVTTTNGAPFPVTTPGVALFTSLWAYFAFILLATTIAFAFGPLIGYLVREGGTYIRKAQEEIEKDVSK